MMNTTKSQKEIDFQQNFAAVRTNVRAAIEGISKVSYKISSDDLKLLDDMKNKLYCHFYDKFELDKIIDEANDIFFKYGLVQ